MIPTYFFLALTGAAFGSFIDAFTWRLHTKRNFVSGRSECEKCHHVLAAKDLIPVYSWLALKGRCRYCGVKLSPVAPLTELAMAALFVASFLVWPYGFAAWQDSVLFGLWLVYLVMLGALFVYDLRWMLLPDTVLTPLILSALGYGLLRISLLPHASLYSYATLAVDALALTAIYWILHTASRGRWVGYGDVKLSIFIGLVAGWQGALLAFGLSNVVGCLVILPGLLSGRLSRKTQLPFGPFLIIGLVIAVLWGSQLIDWYLGYLSL